MTIKDMIRKLFDLWCQSLWMRQIDKECYLRDKHCRLYHHHQKVADKLWEKYNAIYGKHGREDAT